MIKVPSASFIKDPLIPVGDSATKEINAILEAPFKNNPVEPLSSLASLFYYSA